jgi:hypothetical protein
MAQHTDSRFPTWVQPDGRPVACRDKIQVLNENLNEIREMAQEALEDAILMGCDETQVRQVMRELVDGLENPYRVTGKTGGDGP